ncbi:MAG: DUF2490 domain-containing protein [Acidobacteriota bacterium]|nr:DUF2490 domain-containing protein [Acidobacteriota bacterium]
MKKLVWIRAAAAVAATWIVCAFVWAQTPPQDDNQFWNEVQLIKALDKKHDLIVIGVLRVGQNLKRPVDERIGAGLAFKPNKYLTLMPTYLYVDQQPFPGRRISEHRLVMNVTGKVNLGKFLFTDRNLYERRVRHDSRDFTVYRNRLQIDYPVKIGSFAFKPFVADEVWYSTQQGPGGRQGWFRNRISGGIIKQFSERLNAEFFYLRQNDGIARPGDVHALGTLVRVFL